MAMVLTSWTSCCAATHDSKCKNCMVSVETLNLRGRLSQNSDQRVIIYSGHTLTKGVQPSFHAKHRHCSHICCIRQTNMAVQEVCRLHVSCYSGLTAHMKSRKQKIPPQTYESLSSTTTCSLIPLEDLSHVDMSSCTSNHVSFMWDLLTTK